MSTNTDKQIGKNLASMRGSRPQQEIADLMRESGHKWSQSTVWSVEKGDRPLRLTEAVDLARILRVPVQLLYGDTRGSTVAGIYNEGEQVFRDCLARIEKLMAVREEIRSYAPESRITEDFLRRFTVRNLAAEAEARERAFRERHDPLGDDQEEVEVVPFGAVFERETGMSLRASDEKEGADRAQHRTKE